MKRIPSLDGLRAVSIGLVLLGHSYGVTGYPKNATTKFLGEFSHFGVVIFFVISGYLITNLLLDERSTRGSISLSAFYLRRTFRIFPASYVYITFAVLMRFLLHHPFPLKFIAFAATYTWCYVPPGGPWVLGHLWSLSVEEQFYLCWPLALVIGFGVRKTVCWTIIFLVPISRLFLPHGSTSMSQYSFPANADALAIGCLLAMYTPQLRRLPHWVYSGVTTGALCIATFAAAYYLPSSVLTRGLIPALAALSIHILVTRNDRFLNNRVMSYIGALSYSLYLYQQPFFPQSATTNKWSSFPLNIVLAIAFALMSFYLIERPMVRIGHRLNKRWLARQDRIAREKKTSPSRNSPELA